MWQHVPVSPTTLEFLPTVDQSAPSTQTVLVTELVSEKGVLTHVQDLVDPMLNAKLSITNQSVDVLLDMMEIHLENAELSSLQPLSDLQR